MSNATNVTCLITLMLYQCPKLHIVIPTQKPSCKPVTKPFIFS